MQYRIISVTAVFSKSKALEELAKEVNAAMAMGWEPVGGVATVHGNLIAQAMIKRR
ncbi:MAG TPA: hypothetical protein VLW52_00315 [Opitutaceae bacterium]|nr:hypothetical protein [Opitutaceae bacterium]